METILQANNSYRIVSKARLNDLSSHIFLSLPFQQMTQLAVSFG